MLHFIMVQKLRTRDFMQFMTDILVVISRSDPAQLFITPTHNDLFTAKVNLVDFLKNNKIHPITDELIDLARERDFDFHWIFKLLQAYTDYHFDSILQEHAGNLLAPVKSYDIERDPEKYEIESTMINDLLYYWASDVERLIGLKALNLYDWQIHLADINTAFNTKYINTTLQPESFAAYNILKEKRKPLSNAYYNLHRLLQAHAIVNDEKESFGRVVNELNEIIDKYNLLINTRNHPAA